LEKHLNCLEKERSDITVERKEVMKFAKTEFDKQVKIHKYGWNGRQIRNAFQTAVALAEHDACRLARDAEHPPKTHSRRQFFEKVANAAVQFDEYLKKVYREPLAEHVNYLKWRNDIYQGPYEGEHKINGHQHSGPDWAQNPDNQYGTRQPPASQWPAGPVAHQNNIAGYGGPNNYNPQQPVQPYNPGYADGFNPTLGYRQPNDTFQPGYGYGGPLPQ
jgi:hypothetical protein